MRENGVHSVLPALDKGGERVAAFDEQLRGERFRTARQVPPQSQETLRVCSQLRTNSSMGELAFKERTFPRLHCFKAQSSRDPHTALAHASGPVTIPIRRKHERRLGCRPFALSQGAYRQFRSAYSEDQRRLGKDLAVQRSAVAGVAVEHDASLRLGPPND